MSLSATQTKALIKAMRRAFDTTKQRCSNPRNKDYKNYGGRGITVCSRWLASFDNFVADMGLRPEGCTLERKDNDKGYCKENCCWATRKTQRNNTRSSRVLELHGESRSVTEWNHLRGYKRGVVDSRLRRGLSAEAALTVPWRHREKKLSPAAVKAARSMRESGLTYEVIKRLFGVSHGTVCAAVHAKGAYQNV